MNFKDYFDVDIAFNPEFFKLTSTLLGGTLDKDYLYANSEEYSRFLGEYIWKPVATKIGISNLNDVAFSCLISIDNEVVGDKHLSSRKMHFTLPNYLFAILNKFGFKADELKEAMNEQGYEDILSATKVAIRVKRLKFANIVKEGKASEYYAEIKNEFGKSDNEMIEFAQKQEKNLILIATRIMNLLPIFEKSPDIKQIKSCFEYDTFCLIIAKSILDTDHLQMFKQGVDADFIYIERYLKAIKQYRIQNPDYNCVINIRDTKTGQVTQYSIDDFEKEYQQYLSRFPHKMPRYTTEFEFRGVLRQAGYPKLESFEPKNPASVSKAEAFLKK